MLWQYIGLIFSFAFRRTTPAIDGLQILTASALPAVGKFAGVRMPATATSDALAYIGLAAIAFVVIRLLCAPYFIWRGQVGEIGTLKLELSKPERIETEYMSRIRAKKRLQLAAAIREAQTHVFVSDRNSGKLLRQQRKIARLVAFVPLGANALNAVGSVQTLIDRVHASQVNENPIDHDGHIAECVRHICAYLHGHVTDEGLALLLPPDIAPETQP